MPRRTSGNQGNPKRKKPTVVLRKAKSPHPRHPIFTWSRGIGVPALLLGIGGSSLMQPPYFWLAVGFVSLGLILLAIDLYSEAWFTKHTRLRLVALVLVACLGLWFTKEVVFLAAPLNLHAWGIN